MDRQSQLRAHASEISAYLEQPTSRILIWYQDKIICAQPDDFTFLSSQLTLVTDLLSQPLYLGRLNSVHYFCCQLEQWTSQFDGLEQIGLRRAAILKVAELGLLFYAQGLLNWHRYHSFCANCGSETRVLQAGHVRKCNNENCGREHYPKTDPAVIFSIVNHSFKEPKILLGRQAGWDDKRHSVIAGFVEPGESLEDSVRREAFEETGLVVDNISYVASQSWPFPGAIMLGFSCETEQQEITLIDQELESANWFSAREIESKCQSGHLKLPFQASISWDLIDRWYTQQMGYPVKSEFGN